MGDRDIVIKGLSEMQEYFEAKAKVAGVGPVAMIFLGWANAARDARELLETPEAASAEPETCESWGPFIEEDGSVEFALCLSVPEMPLCTCGGDKKKCNFYGG